MNEHHTYRDLTTVRIYAMMGFCSAGTFHLSSKGMLMVTLACLCQGVVMVTIGHMDLHLYARRFFGSLIPSIIIVLLYRMIAPVENPYLIMSSMFMPIASGTTLVQGICHSKEKSGRMMIPEALTIAICLELGAFIRIRMGGIVGWLR